MIDDGTVFRLGKDNFRWIGGTDYGGDWMREQAAKLALKVLVRNSTDMQHNIAVQGPESRDLLKINLFGLHRINQSLKSWLGSGLLRRALVMTRESQSLFRARAIPVNLAMRFSAIPNMRKPCLTRFGTAGQAHGLKPMGLEALDMLRIEAGLDFRWL